VRAALSIALAFVVACDGPTTLPSPSPSVSASATPSGASTAITAPTASTASSPALRFTLIDVRSGERFTLGGFAGKTVIVEGMAVW